MTEREFKRAWNYYLTLESDLDNTSRYVEPKGQINTYSFEFAKLLILSCVEIESGFKNLCKLIDGSNAKNMYDYRTTILGKYPHIIKAEVNVPRLEKIIRPFKGWIADQNVDSCGLEWWDAYNAVKHSIGEQLKNASYKNACYALSALYILMLYLGQSSGINIDSYLGNYITSPNTSVFITFGKGIDLPDF